MSRSPLIAATAIGVLAAQLLSLRLTRPKIPGSRSQNHAIGSARLFASLCIQKDAMLAQAGASRLGQGDSSICCSGAAMVMHVTQSLMVLLHRLEHTQWHAP